MKSTVENSMTDKKNSPNKAELAGGLQETLLKKVTELGDMLERVGEKTEKSGFEKVGEALYQLGNKIEHLRDRFEKPAHRNESSIPVAGQFSGASVTSSEGLRSQGAKQKSDSIPVIER